MPTEIIFEIIFQNPPQAEYGVLARTLEVLRAKHESVQQLLTNLESEKGVSGFRSTQENLERVAVAKADLDEKKGETLEDMSGLVHQLTLKVFVGGPELEMARFERSPSTNDNKYGCYVAQRDL